MSMGRYEEMGEHRRLPFSISIIQDERGRQRESDGESERK